jgi:hypothetical protein
MNKLYIEQEADKIARFYHDEDTFKEGFIKGGTWVSDQEKSSHQRKDVAILQLVEYINNMHNLIGKPTRFSEELNDLIKHIKEDVE